MTQIQAQRIRLTSEQAAYVASFTDQAGISYLMNSSNKTTESARLRVPVQWNDETKEIVITTW